MINLLGGGYIDGIKIEAPNVLLASEYDYILLSNLTAHITIQWIEQLASIGISKDKIVYDWCVYISDARNLFLEHFSEHIYKKGIRGSVAEAGVYKGDFAKVINECFPDRKLYLFDTFEGFVREDVLKEHTDISDQIGRFGDTTADVVLSKMFFPDNVIIKEGRFPDTTYGIEDTFCFVNLDMDLQLPTWAGLEFFSRRMEPDGIILIHDYFSKIFSGIRECVDEWMSDKDKLTLLPIGDELSIMITGFGPGR